MTAPRARMESVRETTLYVAFELGKTEWKLAMTVGMRVDPWVRTVAAGDVAAVTRVLEAARARWGCRRRRRS